MKTLLICSQDLHELRLGLACGSVLLQEKDFLVEPDEYLGAVEQALRAWGVASADLEKIAVVTGPGSFTGSRVSVTLGNGLAFAWGLPVVGLANPERLGLAQLAAQAAAAAPAGPAIWPLYDRPPHITVPTPR
jgi:tRNA threonylcarbamoyladenosine biosynthesis protein TsaB